MTQQFQTTDASSEKAGAESRLHRRAANRRFEIFSE